MVGRNVREKEAGLSIEEHLPEAEASMMDTAHLGDSRCYDLMWAANIVKRARRANEEP